MKMYCQPCRVISVAAALVAAMATAGAAADLSLQDIVVIAQSVRERIASIDAAFEETQELIEGDLPLLVPVLRGRMRYDGKTGNYRWRKESADPQADNKMSEMEYAYYDGTATFYDPTFKQGSISEPAARPINPLAAERLLTGALMHLPRPDGHGVDDASLVSLLKYGSLRRKRAEIAGRSCHIVDANFKDASGTSRRYATVWLDVERGAMPMRTLLYGNDGAQVVDARVLQSQPFDDGTGQTIWLPTKMEYLTTRGGNRVKLVVTADTARTKLNPVLDQSTFMIGFPQGTTVTDSVTNTIFVVEGAPPGGSAQRMAAVWLMGSAVLVVLLLLLVRRFSERTLKPST